MQKNKSLLVLFLVSIAFAVLTFVQFPKHAFLYGLIQSWFMSKGLVIYRDFVDAYLPLLKLLSIPVHQIFGFNQWVTIIASPILSILISVILYLMSKRWLKGISRFIPLLIFNIWNPFISGNQFTTTGFVGFCLLLMLYFWFDWVERKKSLSLFLTGLFGSTAILSLQIVVPFVMILLLTSLFVSKNELSLLKRIIIILAGVLIPVIYVLLWFWTKGALYEFFYWNFLYYFQGGYPYSDLGRDPSLVLIFFSLHAPVLLCVAYLFTKVSKSDIFRPYTYLLFVVAFLSLPVIFWFAVFHPMRFQISLPIFAFLFGFCWHLKSDLKKMRHRQIALTALVAIAAFQMFTLFKYAAPLYAKQIQGKQSSFIISKVYPNDSMFPAIEWVKNNTQEKDTIFVIGDTLFYFDAKRLPANSRSTATEPIVYVPLDSLSNELKQESPNYWIIDERMFLRFSKEWKMPEVTDYFENALSCQKKVISFDYWSIYEQINSECF